MARLPKKMYVLKNVKTGKYYSEGICGHTYTKNIFEAATYDQKWVDETHKYIKDGEKMMGRNEQFVEVTMREV